MNPAIARAISRLADRIAGLAFCSWLGHAWEVRPYDRRYQCATCGRLGSVVRPLIVVPVSHSQYRNWLNRMSPPVSHRVAMCPADLAGLPDNAIVLFLDGPTNSYRATELAHMRSIVEAYFARGWTYTSKTV